MRLSSGTQKRKCGISEFHHGLIAGILAWTKIRLSNGALEGMNNQIKSISQRPTASVAPRTLSRPSITAARDCRCRRKTDYTFGIRAAIFANRHRCYDPAVIRTSLELREGSLKHKRNRKQFGSVVLDKRRKVWMFLYRGNGQRRSKVIGTQQEYRSKSAAFAAAKPSVAEFHKLLDALGNDQRLRTLVMVAISLGLRISECLGLRWSDINWLGKTVSIQRGVVKQIVDDVESANSAKELDAADELLQVLHQWKQTTQLSAAEDWVFASPWKYGKQPICYTYVWESLDEAAEKAGIEHIGAHVFHHLFRAWVDSVGTTIGVQQRLMRHSDIRTTMAYGDPLAADMKQAHEKIAKLALVPKIA
jgi:integrase